MPHEPLRDRLIVVNDERVLQRMSQQQTETQPHRCHGDVDETQHACFVLVDQPGIPETLLCHTFGLPLADCDQTSASTSRRFETAMSERREAERAVCSEP